MDTIGKGQAHGADKTKRGDKVAYRGAAMRTGALLIVVSGNKKQVFTKNAQVLCTFSYVRHIMGYLKQQPLPIVNLHKENQQGPWGKRKAKQLRILLKGICKNQQQMERVQGWAALRYLKIRNEGEPWLVWLDGLSTNL